MNNFDNCISEYVRNYFVTAISGVGNKASEELRLSFCGPPQFMLESIFGTLLQGEAKLIFEIDGSELEALVFLVDEDASDEPIVAGVSCHCTSGNLNSLRNQNFDCFVFLHSVQESISASLQTANVKVGLQGKQKQFDQWIAEPLVTHIVDQILGRFGIAEKTEFKNTLHACLRETWAKEESSPQKSLTWELLKHLMDSAIPKGENYTYFLGLLGTVNCEASQVGSKPHLDVLNRLGVSFEASYFDKSFADFFESSDEEYKGYLKQLQAHLSGCIMPKDFTESPISAYRPKLIDSSLPRWWEKLTLDVWNDLLSGSVPLSTGLRVRFINDLSGPKAGLPSLYRDDVHFEIEIDSQAPAVVEIQRASGSKNLQTIGKLGVTSGSPKQWTDNEVPDHDKYVRYRFLADGMKPVTVKAISLENYSNCVVATASSAKKVTAFKKKKKKGKKTEEFECDMELHGLGSHRLDLFKASHVQISKEMACFENSSESDFESESRLIAENDENSSVVVVDADEECTFEFQATFAGNSVIFRIHATSTDQTPTGTASVFEQLVVEHTKDKKGSTRVEPKPSRLTDLQSWMLSDPKESYRPVGLGPDFLTDWRLPKWRLHDTLSTKEQLLAPWPTPDELVAPDDFATSRHAVLGALIEGTGSESFNPLEAVRLHELMSQESFRSNLSDMLGSYIDWLRKDYRVAIWSDIVALFYEESAAGSLASFPFAILVSPFHPVRLGWQCIAQDLLFRESKQNCPAASTLNPAVNPDCLLLPCQMPSGEFKLRPYVSLPSSSDYWSVLWSTDALEKLNAVGEDPFFDDGLGIAVEGLTTGFTSQQVVRSLDEVSKILAARSRLTMSITSDTKGVSKCNDGIEEWCVANLGDESDHWSVAGGKTLEVYDYRHESTHPEQAALASLTAQTQGKVVWYRRSGDDERRRTDLSVVDHLGWAHPEFQSTSLRSPLDKSGLRRSRIRKQVSRENSFVAESRVCKPPKEYDGDTLNGRIIECLDLIESKCSREFDSFVFAPKLATLWKGIDTSRFAAVTSSNIDAACFFGAHKQNAFLWDYELPRFSSQAGENSGYFLLAQQSGSMVTAVKAATSTLSTNSSLDDVKINELLNEVSRRGIPTLKRLTGGGSISLGEVGVLAGFKIMQSDFEATETDHGLLAAFDEIDQTINLIIPVDSFQNHFEDLRRSLMSEKGQRPDLLVFSILHVKGEAKVVRLTPIEIKTRSSVNPMSRKDRGGALEQASSFAEFLLRMEGVAGESELWGIAWRGLMASMLDYGFRVYGQLEKFIGNQDWESLQASVLEQLASGTLELQIDGRGRLILFDGSVTESKLKDNDQKEFFRTMQISHADAFRVLNGDATSLKVAIRKTVGDWELKPLVEVPEQADASVRNKKTALQTIEPAEGGAPDVLETGAEADPEEVAANEPDQTPEVADKGIRFKIGSTVDGFEERDVHFFPGNTALNQLNVGIVGDLGTGKTQLIKSIVYQATRGATMNRGKKPNILIFDYKKDYSKLDFVEATEAKVIQPDNIPLNIFDTRDCPVKKAWLEKSRFFNDVLSKIYSGIGPAQQNKLKQAVKAAFQSCDALEQKDPLIKDVFKSYSEIVGDKVDAPFSIMSDFVDGEYFTSNRSEIITFAEFLDGVVVLDLSAVGQDDRTKNMLVVIFLNLFYDHMLKIEKKPFWGTDPQLRFIDTWLLVDEADNIMMYEFDILKKILLQGREFGVGALLASQYLSHFKTAHENYLEPLLTWFVHKVPNVTIKELEGIGLTRADSETVERIKTLGVHECLVKTLDADGKFVRGVPMFELLKDK